MRLALALLAVLVVSPAYAQRVFKASVLIDDVQDQRLDAVEAKVDNLHQSVALLAQAVNTLAEVQKAQSVVAKPQPQLASVRVESAPLRKTTTVTVAPAPPQEISPYYSTEELRQQIHSIRPGLKSYADDAYMARGSNVYNHLVSSEHGFTRSQVQGLSFQEANILHALAPNHKNAIFPRRPVQQQQQSVVQVAYNPQPRPQQQVLPNCAFGTCTPANVSVSYSRPRFRLLR